MQDVLGDATAADLAAAWRLAYAVCGAADGADAAAEAAVAAQVSWLGPPSPVELLTATYREVEPAATTEWADGEVDPLLDAWWSLPVDQRAALWLYRVEGRSSTVAAEILSMAPSAVVSLAESAQDRIVAGGAGQDCPPRPVLERQGAGDLSLREADALTAHLDGCQTCTERLTLARRLVDLGNPVTGPVPSATAAGRAALDDCLVAIPEAWAGDLIDESVAARPTPTRAPVAPSTPLAAEPSGPTKPRWRGRRRSDRATATSKPAEAGLPDAEPVAPGSGPPVPEPTAPGEPAPESPAPVAHVAEPDDTGGLTLAFSRATDALAEAEELPSGDVAAAALAAFRSALGEEVVVARRPAPPEAAPPAMPDPMTAEADVVAAGDSPAAEGPVPRPARHRGLKGLLRRPGRRNAEAAGWADPTAARTGAGGEVSELPLAEPTTDKRDEAHAGAAAEEAPTEAPAAEETPASEGEAAEAEAGTDEAEGVAVTQTDARPAPQAAGAGTGEAAIWSAEAELELELAGIVTDDAEWVPDDATWADFGRDLTPAEPVQGLAAPPQPTEGPQPAEATDSRRRRPVTVVADESDDQPVAAGGRRLWVAPRILAGAAAAVFAASVVGALVVHPHHLPHSETVKVGTGKNLLPKDPTTTTPNGDNPLLVIPPGSPITIPMPGFVIPGAPGIPGPPPPAPSTTTAVAGPPTTAGKAGGHSSGGGYTPGSGGGGYTPPTGTTTTTPHQTTTTTPHQTTTTIPRQTTTTCVLLFCG